MFYPGQPVFLKDDKLIGIFLGEDDKFSKNASLSTRVSYSVNPRTDFYVMVLNPDTEEGYELSIYEHKDIAPLIQPTSNPITKQAIYYGPKDSDGKFLFRLPHWHSKLTNHALDQNTLRYLKFL